MSHLYRYLFFASKTPTLEKCAIQIIVNILFTATAMQNCHGRAVLDFLIDYWTISNFMVKFHSRPKSQMFYLVLNYMGEYIHLLIKAVLNAMGCSCLEVNVQLSKKLSC